MPSPATLYGDAVASGGWTDSSNAFGANDGSYATATDNSSVEYGLDDVTDLSVTTEVEYGGTWTAVKGTTGRNQSCLFELIDSIGTVHDSFETAVRDDAALITVNATFNPTDNQATVNDYRIRVTPQEGGGMGGTKTQYLDSVYALVTYTESSDSSQARVMFIG